MENKNVTIDLPVEAWNVVLNALAQRPFAEVSPLIDEIRRQASEQVNAAQQPETVIKTPNFEE